MSPIIRAGVILVNLALVSYSIAILTEQRRKIVSGVVLTFLTTGVLLDISATVCMIAGSENPFITVHGIIGYLALTAMLADAVLLWKLRLTSGKNRIAGRFLHLYSRYAYIWWVVAYFTGAAIVAVNTM